MFIITLFGNLFSQDLMSNNLFYSNIGVKTNINFFSKQKSNVNYLSVNYLHKIYKQFYVGVGIAVGSSYSFKFENYYTDLISDNCIEMKLLYDLKYKRIHLLTGVNIGADVISSSLISDSSQYSKSDEVNFLFYIKPQVLLNYRFNNGFFLGVGYQYQLNSFLSNFSDYSFNLGVVF